MRLHLTDGTFRKMPVYANLLGYAITGVTFDASDIAYLRSAPDEKLYDFLDHLHTRFAPRTLRDDLYLTPNQRSEP